MLLLIGFILLLKQLEVDEVLIGLAPLNKTFKILLTVVILDLHPVELGDLLVLLAFVPLIDHLVIGLVQEQLKPYLEVLLGVAKL